MGGAARGQWKRGNLQQEVVRERHWRRDAEREIERERARRDSNRHVRRGTPSENTNEDDTYIQG